MKNGKYYRIGTDEPEKLIRALDRANEAAWMKAHFKAAIHQVGRYFQY